LRSTRRRLRKFLSLPSSERLLLIKSALMLMAIKVGLKLLPFRHLNSLLARTSHTPRHSRKNGSFKPDQLVRSVDIASRYIPGAGNCLVQALSAQALLARHGHPATVRIGVTHDEENQFKAHAWLESEGKVVIGGPDLDGYAPLLAIERNTS